MMNILISLAFGLLHGIWRRCYGGFDSDIWKKLFPKHSSVLHRNFWRIVDLASVFSMSYFHFGLDWIWSLYIYFDDSYAEMKTRNLSRQISVNKHIVI